MNDELGWIAECCARWQLDEKWLLAVNLRVANQWSESIARSGQPLLNVHPQTMNAMILRMVSDRLASDKLQFADVTTASFLVQQIVADLAGAGKFVYFRSVQSEERLGEIMARSVRDLRDAGVTPDALEPAHFEVAAKADDLRMVLSRYLGELERLRLTDFAGCCELLLAEMAMESFRWPDIRILVPYLIRTTKLQTDILSRLRGRGLVWQPDRDDSPAVVDNAKPMDHPAAVGLSLSHP